MVMFTHGGPAARAVPAGRPRCPFLRRAPCRRERRHPGRRRPARSIPAMSNIDFEIGDGNPAAVAIRFHVAQHGVLSHMDFHVGSGLAALTEIGNEAEDLRFYGGRYGILTDNTSPFWQFTLIDSVFEGQREAAIREHMAGLTLVRDTFRNVPVAIDIDPHYSDQLWVKDSRFEHVSRAAVVISNEQQPVDRSRRRERDVRGRAGLRAFRESGRTTAGAGRHLPRRAASTTASSSRPWEPPGTSTRCTTPRRSARCPRRCRRRFRRCRPSSEWVNVHTLGVKGDGQTDDTAAHPAGGRRASRPLLPHRPLHRPRHDRAAGPTRVLIALHPGMTQLDLPDNDARATRASATPKPVLQAPHGGTNIVSGLGIYTGGTNPRARRHALDGRRALARRRRAVPRGRGGTFCRRRSARPSTAPAAAAGRSPPAAGARSTRASGSPTAAAARSPTSGRRTPSRRPASTCPTRRRRATSTSCRTSTTSSTRSSSTTWRTGTSTRRRPRRKRPTSPEAVSLEISLVEEHHHRELSRLPRHAHARAVPGRGAPLQLVRHPLPQRARQRRERLRDLRRQRLRHVPAREQVPVRERRPGRDAPPRGARARVRGARRPGRPAGARTGATRLPSLAAGAIGTTASRAASTRSRARPWTPPARSTSSIAISSGSSRGRAPSGLGIVRHDAARSGQPRRRPVRPPAGRVVGRATTARSTPSIPARRPDALTVLEPQASRGSSRCGGRRCRSTSGTTASSPTSSISRPTIQDAGADVRARTSATPKDDGVRLAGRQPLPARRAVSSGRGPTTRIRAWTRPAGAGRTTSMRTGFSRRCRGARVYVASDAENRTYRATVQADGTLARPRAVRRARRRERRGRQRRQRLRRQRADLRLRHGRRRRSARSTCPSGRSRSCSADRTAARSSSSAIARSTPCRRARRERHSPGRRIGEPGGVDGRPMCHPPDWRTTPCGSGTRLAA